MTTLFTHIRQLVGVGPGLAPLRGRALAELPVLDDAWLLVEGDQIAGFGPMADLDRRDPAPPSEVVDASGRLLLPAWCDPHTHLVFAGDRSAEFVDKIRGLSYAEIAARGGGILSSARKVADASEDDLFRQAWLRLEEIARLGTGAVEIKSGYGLSLEGELKLLRVIRRLKERSRLSIRATFLGAHAWPPEYRDDHEGYLRLLTDVMLPAVAREGLADYVDVFCEQGFFSPAETERVCRAALVLGLRPRLHANQLHVSGGVQVGVALGAVSVDHLEAMDDDAIAALAGSDTIGTMLPNAALFLRMPFPPARRMIESGCAVALASDYNPGSAPSGNMNLVVALACSQLRMLPEEAINAATVNAACAGQWQGELGSIATGKRANLILTKPVPSTAFLPYAFGSDLIEQVWLGGEPVREGGIGARS